MYIKLFLMLAVSFVTMYAVGFLNADKFDHVMLSYTRAYMAALMVAPMAIWMIAFMWSMYKNKIANGVIILGAVLTFFLSLYLLRSQVPIKDVQYMKAMIPHHSSAIMVSQEADLQDPETKRLAKEIIIAQEREIAEMKKILYRLQSDER